MSIRLLLVFVFVFWLTRNDARTQGWSTVTPNDAGEGNSSGFRPLSLGFSRYQQVYNATDFVAAIGWEGGYITNMLFRLDSIDGRTVGGFVTNLQVSLSTTLRQPDSLSTVFDENIGANSLMVVNPRTEYLAGSLFPTVPQPWTEGTLISFDVPFLYRPSDGNLLVDFRINGGTSFGNYLDAWDRMGDSVSSVYGGLNDPFGTVSTLGLVTRFEGSVIPEPSTTSLLLLGAATLLMTRKRRS